MPTPSFWPPQPGSKEFWAAGGVSRQRPELRVPGSGAGGLGSRDLGRTASGTTEFSALAFARVWECRQPLGAGEAEEVQHPLGATPPPLPRACHILSLA